LYRNINETHYEFMLSELDYGKIFLKIQNARHLLVIISFFGMYKLWPSVQMLAVVYKTKGVCYLHVRHYFFFSLQNV
jgi:hypothetical protein